MNNRQTFRIGPNPRNLVTIQALNYDQAANIAARKIHGNSAACAIRIWGLYDFGGLYRAYIVNKHKNLVYIGDPFHLQMLYKSECCAYCERKK